MPLGSLAAGVALDAVGGTMTLAAIGALLILAATLFSLRPAVRTARLAS
jgi:hypothetical protein